MKVLTAQKFAKDAKSAKPASMDELKKIEKSKSKSTSKTKAKGKSK